MAQGQDEGGEGKELSSACSACTEETLGCHSRRGKASSFGKLMLLSSTWEQSLKLTFRQNRYFLKF